MSLYTSRQVAEAIEVALHEQILREINKPTVARMILAAVRPVNPASHLIVETFNGQFFRIDVSVARQTSTE